MSDPSDNPEFLISSAIEGYYIGTSKTVRITEVSINDAIYAFHLNLI